MYACTVLVQADLPVDYEKAAERYLKASDAKNAEVRERDKTRFTFIRDFTAVVASRRSLFGTDRRAICKVKTW